MIPLPAGYLSQQTIRRHLKKEFKMKLRYDFLIQSRPLFSMLLFSTKAPKVCHSWPACPKEQHGFYS
jgi:hypothetical protein